MVMLSGCARDLDFNPYTTVLKHMMKVNNEVE